jgi:hypothetical protein
MEIHEPLQPKRLTVAGMTNQRALEVWALVVYLGCAAFFWVACLDMIGKKKLM